MSHLFNTANWIRAACLNTASGELDKKKKREKGKGEREIRKTERKGTRIPTKKQKESKSSAHKHSAQDCKEECSKGSVEQLDLPVPSSNDSHFKKKTKHKSKKNNFNKSQNDT